MSAVELFSLGFMQRALIAALFTGIAAPAIGTYLVQRRLALMGDGIGHVAVTGVAAGLVTGASPTWTAVVVAVLGAVLIETIRERGHTNGDVALALLFYGGLAGGVLLTGLGGKSASDLQIYLFGSILTISVIDVVVTMALAAVVALLALGLSPQLFAVAQDQEFARVTGLNVRAYNLLIAVLAAVSVTVAMRTVGLLLVSALMVVPVATAQQLTRSFRATLVAAMGLGVAASVGGLVLAAFASSSATVAPGATIVLVSLAGFALTWPLGAWSRHRQHLHEPFVDPPPQVHEPPTTTTTRTTTSTASTAATRPCRTTTTSTTSTTGTATRPTGATMTSTELRPTRQRTAVAQVLASLAEFRSAQEIHALLAERGDRVGLATVYRTLQRLADAGDVDVLRTEDGEAAYRRCSPSHHHHLVCRTCGATVEVEGPTVERWTRAIAEEHGYAEVSHTLEIFGRCGGCAGDAVS